MAKDTAYYIKRIQHYKGRLRLLRDSINILLEQMDKDFPPEDEPVRKRRNLREERMAQFGHGTWRKPAELKGKKKSPKK